MADDNKARITFFGSATPGAVISGSLEVKSEEVWLTSDEQISVCQRIISLMQGDMFVKDEVEK